MLIIFVLCQKAIKSEIKIRYVFLTFQVVNRAELSTRKCYRDILIESFNYSRTYKNLILHAYVIMSNHVHCSLSSENNLSDIVRDFNKHTSKAILKSIEGQPESRREWLLMIFEYHAINNFIYLIINFSFIVP
jgi:REP element-mobilizing transposase RayT